MICSPVTELAVVVLSPSMDYTCRFARIKCAFLYFNRFYIQLLKLFSLVLSLHLQVHKNTMLPAANRLVQVIRNTPAGPGLSCLLEKLDLLTPRIARTVNCLQCSNCNCTLPTQLYIRHECKKKIFLPYHKELVDDYGFCRVCDSHHDGGHFCSGLTDVSINLVGLNEVPNPSTQQSKQKFERQPRTSRGVSNELCSGLENVSSEIEEKRGWRAQVLAPTQKVTKG